MPNPVIEQLEDEPWSEEHLSYLYAEALKVPAPVIPGATRRHAFWMHGVRQGEWNNQELNDNASLLLARHHTVIHNATWGSTEQREKANAIIKKAKRHNKGLAILGYVPTNVPPGPTAEGSLQKLLLDCPEEFQYKVGGVWRPPPKQGWLHIDFLKDGAPEWWYETVNGYLEREGFYTGICLDQMFAAHHVSDWPDKKYAVSHREGKVKLLQYIRSQRPYMRVGIIFGPWEEDELDLDMIGLATDFIEEGALTKHRPPMRLARAADRYMELGYYKEATRPVSLLATKVRERDDEMPLVDPLEDLYGYALACIADGSWSVDGGGNGGAGKSHTELYWFPWHNAELGHPLHDPEISAGGDIVKREFMNGTVIAHTGGIQKPAENGEYFPRWRSDIERIGVHRRVSFRTPKWSYRNQEMVDEIWLRAWEADVLTTEAPTEIYEPNYVPPSIAPAVAQYKRELRGEQVD